jgi:hypothetical protein
MDGVVKRLPIDPDIVECLPDSGVAVAGDAGVILVPNNAIGRTRGCDIHDDIGRITVTDE